MLSRIAESLYWVGRFCERAEDTARLLDVHYHLLLEDRWADETAICQGLLDVMGVDADALGVEPDSAAVTALLATDPTYPGSIARSLAGAWENARGAREVVSEEIWETLNSTSQSLPTRGARVAGSARHDYFRWVKDRTAVLGGLVESTMSRDDGFRFLVVGRNLERADMTARIVSARDDSDARAPTSWATTLRCCSAYEAYLRTYRRGVDGESAAEFLLLDRWFPRSVNFVLHAAEDCLAELDPIAERAGTGDDGRRRLGRMCAELQFLRADEVLSDLHEVLGRVQAGCAEVHSAVAQRYFQEAHAIEWSV